MALGEISVTVEGVQKVRDSLYIASVRLVIPDSDQDWDGIDEVVSHRWNEGGDINDWKLSIGQKCQDVIDIYKDEKAKATSGAMTNIVQQIQNNLEV